MKMKLNPVVIGIIAIWVLVFVIFLSSSEKSVKTTEEGLTIGTEIGNAAPNFALQTPDDRTLALEDFKGKAVIINFWAMWCTPCEYEMPLLQNAFEKNEDNLIILAVNLQERYVDEIVAYANRLHLTFPILLDPNAEVSTLYNFRVPPTTYFIDKNGIIQDRKFGPLTEEELEQKVQKIL